MSSAASGREVTAPEIQRLSVVVPVYQGERTLDLLMEEIVPLTTPRSTPRGRPFQVVEVVLVHEEVEPCSVGGCAKRFDSDGATPSGPTISE
jgi:hypothetical protein